MNNIITQQSFLRDSSLEGIISEGCSIFVYYNMRKQIDNADYLLTTNIGSKLTKCDNYLVMEAC